MRSLCDERGNADASMKGSFKSKLAYNGVYFISAGKLRLSIAPDLTLSHHNEVAVDHDQAYFSADTRLLPFEYLSVNVFFQPS